MKLFLEKSSENWDQMEGPKDRGCTENSPQRLSSSLSTEEVWGECRSHFTAAPVRRLTRGSVCTPAPVSDWLRAMGGKGSLLTETKSSQG